MNSLVIGTDEITSVLLADGWHPVIDESFELHEEILVGDDALVDGSGFVFETNGGVWMHGPRASVLAVQTKP